MAEQTRPNTLVIRNSRRYYSFRTILRDLLHIQNYSILKIVASIFHSVVTKQMQQTLSTPHDLVIFYKTR